MTESKAYFLGMLVGGGIINDSSFNVVLPFRKWGTLATNINDIAADVVTQISRICFETYGFHLQFEIGNGKWFLSPLECIDIAPIREDLKNLGLPTIGTLLNNADLSLAKKTLSINEAESFISGIFDTRGSLAKSHRRFADDAPVVSLEIPGSTKNFQFVVQLCSWLHELDTTTDQILYNHPYQQSPSDPYYKGWKKGFKIRFLAKSYMETNSFALRAKARDVSSMSRRQTREEQIPCENRPVSANTLCIHSDIFSEDLPKEVRGKLFLHYSHICAVIGCPFAPIKKLQELARQYRCFISALPLLTKDNKTEITKVFNNIKDEYLSEHELSYSTRRISSLCNSERLQPYKKLKEGLAYLLSEQLNGVRHVGSMNDILNSNMDASVEVTTVSVTGFPLMIVNPVNERAILVSSVGTNFNNTLLDSQLTVDGLDIIVNNERN